MSLKDVLLSHKYFIDNDYLDKYVRLIERNRRTRRVSTKTNLHHIIPRSWFKLNCLEVDNNLTNLVNLAYRDHVLAHYYLTLCTQDPLQYANQLAFFLLIENKKLNSVDKCLVQRLPLYNNIYENYQVKLKHNYKLYGELHDNKRDC